MYVEFKWNHFFCLGIRAVAECLAKSNSEETQDCARNLLQQLSNVSTTADYILEVLTNDYLTYTNKKYILHSSQPAERDNSFVEIFPPVGTNVSPELHVL